MDSSAARRHPVVPPADTGRGLTEHSREVVGIEALRRAGFAESFTVDGHCLRVTGSERTFSPETVRIVDYYRFEGTSDPDDLSVVYALETRDGTRGLLVDAYGSYADPGVGALLDRMAIDRRPRGTAWYRALRPWWLVAGAVAAGLLGFAVVRRGMRVGKGLPIENARRRRYHRGGTSWPTETEKSLSRDPAPRVPDVRSTHRRPRGGVLPAR